MCVRLNWFHRGDLKQETPESHGKLGFDGKKHAQSRHRMMDNTMVTQIVINYGCTNFHKMDKSSWLHYGWCNNMQQLWSDFSVFLILLHEPAISNGYEQTWSLEFRIQLTTKQSMVCLRENFNNRKPWFEHNWRLP